RPAIGSVRVPPSSTARLRRASRGSERASRTVYPSVMSCGLQGVKPRTRRRARRPPSASRRLTVRGDSGSLFGPCARALSFLPVPPFTPAVPPSRVRTGGGLPASQGLTRRVERTAAQTDRTSSRCPFDLRSQGLFFCPGVF